MLRSTRFGRLAVGLSALAVVLVLACGNAQAKPKPWKIIGAGEAPHGIPTPGAPPGPHWAVGLATELGLYAGAGAVKTDTNNLVFHADGSITGEFGSAVPFVFKGLDGDTLSCQYGRADVPAGQGKAAHPGTFTLVPQADGSYQAFWIAEFVPVPSGCTGKFKGVSGSWIMYAVSEPFELGGTDPVGYAWAGEGTLNFK